MKKTLQPIIRQPEQSHYMDIPKNYNEYTVFQHDSWGNKKDGFESNNRYNLFDVIVRNDTTNKDIMQGLKRIGLLKKHVRMNMLSIIQDESIIIIESCFGELLYTLEWSYDEQTKGKDRIEA